MSFKYELPNGVLVSVGPGCGYEQPIDALNAYEAGTLTQEITPIIDTAIKDQVTEASTLETSRDTLGGIPTPWCNK